MHAAKPTEHCQIRLTGIDLDNWQLGLSKQVELLTDDDRREHGQSAL